MTQIRPLTEAQLVYVIRCYHAGWGLEPISKRLHGVGCLSVKAHLIAAGVAIRQPGGYRKMEPRLPPPFVKPKPKKVRPAPQPKAPPDPRVIAWHKPISPGWRVHGEVIYGPKRRAS